MWITVKGYHGLGRYTADLPADGRMPVPDGASAARVMGLLHVPGHIQADILLFINGRPSACDRVLQAGDNLVLLERVAGG